MKEFTNIEDLNKKELEELVAYSSGVLLNALKALNGSSSVNNISIRTTFDDGSGQETPWTIYLTKEKSDGLQSNSIH